MFPRTIFLRLIAALAIALVSIDAAGAQTPTKGTLYVLTVGVTKYQHDPNHTTWMTKAVEYAAKDAEDLARVFKTQQGRLYQRVECVTLTNERATKENIERALASLRSVVRAGDGVIVFVASHGGSGKHGYAFTPYDARPDNGSQDVTGATLRQSLAGLPGTCLLILDTCHAGAVASSTSASMQPMTELANQAGILVYAGCGITEGGLEIKGLLKNGLFTHALIQALEGRADVNHDGVVTLAEVDAYVDNLVRQISQGRQNPTMQRPVCIPSGFALTMPVASTQPSHP
jgi:uncharacterized caspase-like protein